MPQQVHYVLAPYSASSEDDEVNLLDLWRMLVSYKWLIFGITLITTVTAVVVAWWMPPVYRAEVTLAPVTPEEGGRLSALAGEFSGIASIAGINMTPGGSSADKAIAVMRSRAFTDAFIKDEKLLPVLFSEVWDVQSSGWKTQGPEDIPTIRKAYDVFDRSVRSITQDKKTGLITLSIEWEDPQLAARWANIMVARLNQHEQQAAISEAEKSLTYLKDQLAKTSVLEMQQSIYRLIEAQTKNIMLASARDQYALSVIDPAVVPETKSKPKRKLIVVIGFAAGLFLAVMIALLVSAIRKLRINAAENLPR